MKRRGPQKPHPKCSRCTTQTVRDGCVDLETGLPLCRWCARERTPARRPAAKVQRLVGRAALREKPCVYCGAPPPSTIDHYMPRALGGTNEPSNLRPACEHCNGLKADMHPDDWEIVVASGGNL